MSSTVLPPALPHPTGKPEVGDLYWVITADCWSNDPKPRRPVVVVRAPVPGLLTDAIVIARTSDVHDTGKSVFHAAIAGATVDVDGKFMAKFEHQIDERLFANGKSTSFAGKLDDITLNNVMTMMGYQ